MAGWTPGKPTTPGRHGWPEMGNADAVSTAEKATMVNVSKGFQEEISCEETEEFRVDFCQIREAPILLDGKSSLELVLLIVVKNK